MSVMFPSADRWTSLNLLMSMMRLCGWIAWCVAGRVMRAPLMPPSPAPDAPNGVEEPMKKNEVQNELSHVRPPWSRHLPLCPGYCVSREGQGRDTSLRGHCTFCAVATCVKEFGQSVGRCLTSARSRPQTRHEAELRGCHGRVYWTLRRASHC